MRTNRLTSPQRQVPFAGMPLWQTSRFGLGLAIAETSAGNPYACCAPGSMTWPGIFGTRWLADPVNDLATGRGAAGRRALPIFQSGTYAALSDMAE